MTAQRAAGPVAATVLLDIHETAARLKTTPPTLRFWRSKGYGPQGAVLGRKLMWREVDVEAFIHEQFAAAESARKGA